MEDLKTKMATQGNAISTIPSGVLANWPSIFSLAIVNYVSDMILENISSMGYARTNVGSALVRSTAQVIRLVSWDATKVTY